MVVSTSALGMQSRTWGALAWTFLHLVSLNYPCQPSQTEKRRFLKWFQGLEDVLPCGLCCESYGKIIRRKGATHLSLDTMQDRESLSLWLWAVHEAVNKRLQKKSTLTFDGMCKKYERLRAADCEGHTCDTRDLTKRKRSVVLVMSDKQFRRAGLRNSMRDITKAGTPSPLRRGSRRSTRAKVR